MIIHVATITAQGHSLQLGVCHDNCVKCTLNGIVVHDVLFIASSSNMGSSKNLLMETSSLRPCRRGGEEEMGGVEGRGRG